MTSKLNLPWVNLIVLRFFLDIVKLFDFLIDDLFCGNMTRVKCLSLGGSGCIQ